MTDEPRTLLNQRERELDLVMALDKIRDDSTDPNSMFTAVVSMLADRFDASLCLLSVAARDSGKLELKAVTHRGERLRHFGPNEVRRVAEHAYEASVISVWEPDDLHRDLSIDNLPPDMHMAAIPVMMGPITRLGAVVLARVGAGFSHDEIALMRVAESQLDSAVIQGYAFFELQQRNKELEVIYRIDRIRDRHLPFDEMLNTVLTQLRDVLQAEMGFIMLYDREGRRLEMRATTHDDLFYASPYAETVSQAAESSIEQAALISLHEPDSEIGAMMCIPLILGENILGVFGVANRRGGRTFDDEDRRLLTAIASQMDTAIFESLEQRRLRSVLGRSVDPRVMERLLQTSDVDFLKGERVTASILYADIRGSTSLAEATPADLLVEFINDYLGTMTEVILKHEGTVDKFVGDEVMATFGVPFPQPDQAMRAVRVGLEMQAYYKILMDRWEPKGITRSPIGIGIASGEVIAGEMGSPSRSEYTVIGRPANLGARICATAHGGEVLISEATYNMIKDQVEIEVVTGLEMKGITGFVTVYRVLGLR